MSKYPFMISKTRPLLTFTSLWLIIFLYSCAKDIGQVGGSGIKTDVQLWAFVQSQKLAWYKSDSTAPETSNSGFHQGAYYLRYNTKLKSQLDQDGTVPSGADLADSSLAVKQLTNPALFAVILKDSRSPYSSNGWVWAIFNPNGTIYKNYSITQTGNPCTGCHTGGRDDMLTFDAHPNYPN